MGSSRRLSLLSVWLHHQLSCSGCNWGYPHKLLSFCNPVHKALYPGSRWSTLISPPSLPLGWPCWLSSYSWEPSPTTGPLHFFVASAWNSLPSDIGMASLPGSLTRLPSRWQLGLWSHLKAPSGKDALPSGLSFNMKSLKMHSWPTVTFSPAH